MAGRRGQRGTGAHGAERRSRSVVLGTAVVAVLALGLVGGAVALGSARADGTTSGSATTTAGSPSGPVTGAASTAARAVGSADPSAAAPAAPQGDLDGWRQVFSDDFATPVAEGSWAGSPYAGRWLAYDGFPDTHKVGRYDAAATLSVADGSLAMRWHTVDGTPVVSGLVPLVDGKWGGMVQGRYSVRFRADSAHAYVAAFLLWPDSNDWKAGEVDFAEGDLDGGINAYHHCPGHPTDSCGTAQTSIGWTDWHTATVEWTPSGVTYFLDGHVVQTSPMVPTSAMHLVLQGFARPGFDPAVSTRVQVDWVSIWSYDPSAAGPA